MSDPEEKKTTLRGTEQQERLFIDNFYLIKRLERVVFGDADLVGLKQQVAELQKPKKLWTVANITLGAVIIGAIVVPVVLHFL